MIEIHYVNKYINNPTSLQMARISLIGEILDLQNNGRNIILFDVYFGKLFYFNILIMFQYSGSNEKNCGDPPSAT